MIKLSNLNWKMSEISNNGCQMDMENKIYIILMLPMVIIKLKLLELDLELLN